MYSSSIYSVRVCGPLSLFFFPAPYFCFIFPNISFQKPHRFPCLIMFETAIKSSQRTISGRLPCKKPTSQIRGENVSHVTDCLQLTMSFFFFSTCARVINKELWPIKPVRQKSINQLCYILMKTPSCVASFEKSKNKWTDWMQMSKNHERRSMDHIRQI